MDGDAAVREVLAQVDRDAISLAEAVRRLFALARTLPEGAPLRAALAPFTELDGRFDLAQAGYADPAALTDDIRRALQALREALGR